MKGYEVGIAFLDDKGSEGKAESDVVEGKGFARCGSGEGCAGDRELEWWGHVVFMQ